MIKVSLYSHFQFSAAYTLALLFLGFKRSALWILALLLWKPIFCSSSTRSPSTSRIHIGTLRTSTRCLWCLQYQITLRRWLPTYQTSDLGILLSIRPHPSAHPGSESRQKRPTTILSCWSTLEVNNYLLTSERRKSWILATIQFRPNGWQLSQFRSRASFCIWSISRRSEIIRNYEIDQSRQINKDDFMEQGYEWYTILNFEICEEINETRISWADLQRVKYGPQALCVLSRTWHQRRQILAFNDDFNQRIITKMFGWSKAAPGILSRTPFCAFSITNEHRHILLSDKNNL